jgi:hypothetical protein
MRGWDRWEKQKVFGDDKVCNKLANIYRSKTKNAQINQMLAPSSQTDVKELLAAHLRFIAIFCIRRLFVHQTRIILGFVH